MSLAAHDIHKRFGPRPILTGASLALRPGETRPVNVRLGVKDFAYWDVKRHALHAAPGE